MAKKKSEVETVVEQPKKSIDPPTEEQLKAIKEANEQRNTDRVNRLNAIADGNDEARSDEMRDTDGEKVFDPDETERRAAEEDAAAKKALEDLQTDPQEHVAEKQQEETQEASDTKVINGVTYYLDVVNGKEKWRTLQEIRRTASIVESADEYLRTAKESVTNASRLALSRDEQSSVEEDDIEKTLSSAIMGDEEATKKLARALKAKLSAVTPDVLQQVDQRISLRTELATLEGEQREILDDPWLSRLFKQRLAEMKEEDETQALSTAYRTVGKELRTAFPEKFRKSSVSQEKLDRKKTLVNAPSAAGRQVERTEEQEEEPIEMTIDKMAKARGQPQSIRHAKH